ncbi:MAG: ABC transporter permease [Planctomycetia bacterium]|nr:MAG: ABC transporter permease [Planctomycetia bacterium]
MTLGYVLLQNLRRNPLRSGLTMVAFALPMAVFVVGISLVLALQQVSKANEAELRLAVQNRIALVNALPERLRREIEALDPEKKRIVAVCGFRWFGGRVPNAKSGIQSLGVDPDTFPIVYRELRWTEEEELNWQRDRRAAVVGSNVAAQYGWRVGDRVTLESTVPPYLALEFVIVKITDVTGRVNGMYLRRDYFEESRAERGFRTPGCNVFWLRCTSIEAMREMQSLIDGHFANSPNETRTMDENAFAASFTEALGNLPGLMQGIALVVVFIVALVAGNTMMMSFRERTRELAVFKAIGFSNRRVFGVVLAESVLLALVGAAAGIAPTAAVLSAVGVRTVGFLPITSLSVSPTAIVVAMCIALSVGVAAGLVPAWQAIRLNTVSALRRVG